MKNSINLALVIFIVTLLSTTMFAQVRPLDGTGNPNASKVNWVDSDGDGICDNFGTDLQGSQSQKRMNKGTGVGNGKGNGSGIKPQDGTGFGKMSGGTNANCTTTLQKGSGRRAAN